MNMKNITLISLFLLLATLGWSQKHYEVFSPDKQLKVSVKTGNVLSYALLHKGDTLIYCDLARWKIQLRYRKCTPNFKQDNDDEDVLKKIKRGFFIESPKMNLNLIQYIMQKHLLFLQMLKNIQLDL